MHVYFGKHVKRALSGGRVVRVVCAVRMRVLLPSGESRHRARRGSVLHRRGPCDPRRREAGAKRSRSATLPRGRAGPVSALQLDQRRAGRRLPDRSLFIPANSQSLHAADRRDRVGRLRIPRRDSRSEGVGVLSDLAAGDRLVRRGGLCVAALAVQPYPAEPGLSPRAPAPAGLTAGPRSTSGKRHLDPRSAADCTGDRGGRLVRFSDREAPIAGRLLRLLEPRAARTRIQRRVPDGALVRRLRTGEQPDLLADFLCAALSGWLVAAAILLPLNLQNEEFWIACLGAAGVCLLVAAVVASKRTAPVKVTSGDRSRSVVRLRFRNVEYTQLVALHRERAAAGGTQSRLSLDLVPPPGQRIPPHGAGRVEDASASKT